MFWDKKRNGLKLTLGKCTETLCSRDTAGRASGNTTGASIVLHHSDSLHRRR